MSKGEIPKGHAAGTVAAHTPCLNRLHFCLCTNGSTPHILSLSTRVASPAERLLLITTACTMPSYNVPTGAPVCTLVVPPHMLCPAASKVKPDVIASKL
jgi:hypothetical protein